MKQRLIRDPVIWSSLCSRHHCIAPVKLPIFQNELLSAQGFGNAGLITTEMVTLTGV